MSFTPRLSKVGMWGNKYWHSNENPLTRAGYGLPNCTCYCWGRWWEISGVKPHLPTSNAGKWYISTSYSKGSIPQLGAVICFSSGKGGVGHVAIVEKILPNGDIVTSNSGYSRPSSYNNKLYFWVETLKKSNGYLQGWEKKYGYRVQGFIYNPEQPKPPSPDDPPSPDPEDPGTPEKNKKHRYKVWLFHKL